MMVPKIHETPVRAGAEPAQRPPAEGAHGQPVVAGGPRLPAAAHEPLPAAGASPMRRHAPVPGNPSRAAWPTAYAMTSLPSSYKPTQMCDVLTNMDETRFYLAHEGLGYELDRYPVYGEAIIFDPDSPIERSRGIWVRLGIDGHWHPDRPVGFRSAAVEPAAPGPVNAPARADAPAPAAHASGLPTAHGDHNDFTSRMQAYASSRIADHLQYYLEPGSTTSNVADVLRVPQAQVRVLARRVGMARRSWSRAQAADALRPSVIVAPLTSREKQFVLNWRNTLFSNCLAELMGKPPEMIDALIAASDRLARAEPTGTGEPNLPRFAGQDGGVPADRVLDVIRCYERRPRLSSAAIAADLGLPQQTVEQIRDVAARASMDWLVMREADMEEAASQGRHTFGPVAHAFVNDWRGRLPLPALLKIVTSPRTDSADSGNTAPRADSGGRAPRVTTARGAPLSLEQMARIQRLGWLGKTPSTISTYLGIPAADIEAYMRTPGYFDYVHRERGAYMPDSER